MKTFQRFVIFFFPVVHIEYLLETFIFIQKVVLNYKAGRITFEGCLQAIKENSQAFKIKINTSGDRNYLIQIVKLI